MIYFLLAMLPTCLVLPSGNYESKECLRGIHRFYEYPKKTEQRIIFDGDVFKFLEGITWIHVHGYKDESLNHQKLEEEAKTRKLSLTCGYINLFTRYLLSKVGMKSRVIQFFTKQKSNGWNDGHFMIEIFHEGSWILVDMDMRKLFRFEDKFLSADELVKIGIDDIEIYQFSDAPIFSYNDLCPKIYNYDFTLSMEEIGLRNDTKSFYRRICQKYSYY